MNMKSEFEKAAIKAGHDPVWDGDQYLYEEVQTAWEIWQAAQAHASGEAVDGASDNLRGVPRCQKCGNLEPFHATGCDTEFGKYATPPASGEAIEKLHRYKKAYGEIYTALGQFLDENADESRMTEADVDEAWQAFNSAPGPVFFDHIESALRHAPASGEAERVANLQMDKGEFVGAKITVGLADSVSLDWATDMVVREAREVSVPDVFDDVVEGKEPGNYLVVFDTELDYADDDCAGSAFEIPHAIRVIPTHPPAARQVPKGWSVRRVDDRITVQHPDFGGYCADLSADDKSQIAPVILYRLAEALLTTTPETVVDGVEPDQFWDADNPETNHSDPYCLADEAAQDLRKGETMTVDVLCGKELPKRTMKIWVTDDGDSVDYEWIQPQPPKAEEN